ncbi:hypothetical protein V8E36_007554 [Tilletia maclaganii]
MTMVRLWSSKRQAVQARFKADGHFPCTQPCQRRDAEASALRAHLPGEEPGSQARVCCRTSCPERHCAPRASRSHLKLRLHSRRHAGRVGPDGMHDGISLNPCAQVVRVGLGRNETLQRSSFSSARSDTALNPSHGSPSRAWSPISQQHPSDSPTVPLTQRPRISSGTWSGHAPHHLWRISRARFHGRYAATGARIYLSSWAAFSTLAVLGIGVAASWTIARRHAPFRVMGRLTPLGHGGLLPPSSLLSMGLRFSILLTRHTDWLYRKSLHHPPCPLLWAVGIVCLIRPGGQEGKDASMNVSCNELCGETESAQGVT